MTIWVLSNRVVALICRPKRNVILQVTAVLVNIRTLWIRLKISRIYFSLVSIFSTYSQNSHRPRNLPISYELTGRSPCPCMYNKRLLYDSTSIGRTFDKSASLLWSVLSLTLVFERAPLIFSFTDLRTILTRSKHSRQSSMPKRL